jgi:thiol-disulfide isomerase/thioredoxin
MTAVQSNMMPLGTQAPNFKLLDVISNEYKTLDELIPNGTLATVVMFICNHCPFVKHIESELVKTAADYQAKNIAFIAISSNDVSLYPDDSPEKMLETAKNHHYSFPYLYDETQQTALAYQAACTPDFYIFDQAKKCVYRGQFDDSRPGNDKPVTGKDMRHALECMVNHQPVPVNQTPSMGCNIKWKNN